MAIRNRLTELLGIEHPIIQGGMAWTATAEFWQQRSVRQEGWASSAPATCQRTCSGSRSEQQSPPRRDHSA